MTTAAGGPRIRDVRVILTAPEGIRLVVVKIETDEPDLYGLGCATFTQRPLAVATAIEQYLKPQVVGRSVHDIEDIWSMLAVSSYWRSGPVLNNAISGIDMALWDIKGKLAGMPLYDLLGGRCRTAATVYVHASGRDPVEVEDEARGFMEQGFTHVRCQVAVPGSSTYGVAGALDSEEPHPAHLRLRQEAWDPSAYARIVPDLFEHLRLTLGDRVELLHDIHERVPPIIAIGMARELEPYRLFFLEDPLAPEDNGYFPLLRQQTSIPIAMGELYVNVNEIPAADQGPPHRLHPRPPLRHRRHHAGPQAGGHVRVLRRAHGLARPGRRLAGRARGEPPSRPRRAEFRHSGGAPLRRRLPGGLPGHPGDS